MGEEEEKESPENHNSRRRRRVEIAGSDTMLQPAALERETYQYGPRHGSGMGRHRLGDVNRRKQLSDDSQLCEELIDVTVGKFLEEVKNGCWESGGWPQIYTDYSVSKLAVNAYTRLIAKKLSIEHEQKICMNCYCPGWVKTAMTGWAGNMTTEEGADTAVWLALFPGEPPTGKPGDFSSACRRRLTGASHRLIGVSCRRPSEVIHIARRYSAARRSHRPMLLRPTLLCRPTLPHRPTPLCLAPLCSSSAPQSLVASISPIVVCSSPHRPSALPPACCVVSNPLLRRLPAASPPTLCSAACLLCRRPTVALQRRSLPAPVMV
ncbi:Salutaridine reductase [Nymphaea thermarum]|nr:Salutaridine reductase [Nymphaea thermarum]